MGSSNAGPSCQLGSSSALFIEEIRQPHPKTIARAIGCGNSTSYRSGRYATPVNVKDVRQANLYGLLYQFKNKPTELGRYLGKKPAQIYQWIEGIRRITEDTAREMESHAKLPSGWFDVKRYAPAQMGLKGELLTASEMEPPSLVDVGPLTAREVDAVLALRALSQRRRDVFISDLMEAAEEAKQFTAEVLAREGVTVVTNRIGEALPIRPDGEQEDTSPGSLDAQVGIIAPKR